MVELSQVYRNGRVAGCELGLHLAKPHLWPRRPKWGKLDGDETVAGAGGAAGAGGIRAWRATAMAWTSWASRAITSGSPIVASLASYLQTKEQLTQELR